MEPLHPWTRERSSADRFTVTIPVRSAAKSKARDSALKERRRPGGKENWDPAKETTRSRTEKRARMSSSPQSLPRNSKRRNVDADLPIPSGWEEYTPVDREAHTHVNDIAVDVTSSIETPFVVHPHIPPCDADFQRSIPSHVQYPSYFPPPFLMNLFIAPLPVSMKMDVGRPMYKHARRCGLIHSPHSPSFTSPPTHRDLSAGSSLSMPATRNIELEEFQNTLDVVLEAVMTGNVPPPLPPSTTSSLAELFKVQLEKAEEDDDMGWELEPVEKPFDFIAMMLEMAESGHVSTSVGVV